MTTKNMYCTVLNSNRQYCAVKIGYRVLYSTYFIVPYCTVLYCIKYGISYISISADNLNKTYKSYVIVMGSSHISLSYSFTFFVFCFLFLPGSQMCFVSKSKKPKYDPAEPYQNIHEYILARRKRRAFHSPFPTRPRAPLCVCVGEGDQWRASARRRWGGRGGREGGWGGGGGLERAALADAGSGGFIKRK